MAKEKPEEKPSWYGSPHRRNPELYYGEVWIDRQMFDNVRLFADWEKLSIKAATYQLLTLGLHFYCVQQLKLEQASLLKETPEHVAVYGVNDFPRLLNNIRKAHKLSAKQAAQEVRHPL